MNELTVDIDTKKGSDKQWNQFYKELMTSSFDWNSGE